jgi:hypothetical protein
MIKSHLFNSICQRHSILFCFVLFLLLLLFFQYRGLHFEQVLFFNGFFQDRTSRIICLGWLQTEILLISASWVARITGMSHQHPDDYLLYNIHFWHFLKFSCFFSKGEALKNIYTLCFCYYLGTLNKLHEQSICCSFKHKASLNKIRKSK